MRYSDNFHYFYLDLSKPTGWKVNALTSCQMLKYKMYGKNRKAQLYRLSYEMMALFFIYSWMFVVKFWGWFITISALENETFILNESVVLRLSIVLIFTKLSSPCRSVRPPHSRRTHRHRHRSTAVACWSDSRCTWPSLLPSSATLLRYSSPRWRRASPSVRSVAARSPTPPKSVDGAGKIYRRIYYKIDRLIAWHLCSNLAVHLNDERRTGALQLMRLLMQLLLVCFIAGGVCQHSTVRLLGVQIELQNALLAAGELLTCTYRQSIKIVWFGIGFDTHTQRWWLSWWNEDWCGWNGRRIVAHGLEAERIVNTNSNISSQITAKNTLGFLTFWGD